MKRKKMLGDIDSKECKAMMRLMETQSEKTVSHWAIHYAKDNYLPIFQKRCEDLRIKNLISKAQQYQKDPSLKKSFQQDLKEVRIWAAKQEDFIVFLSAKAILTACASLITITNAFGFLFYGCAATIYEREENQQMVECEEQAIQQEWQKAIDSFGKVAVTEEMHPAHWKWNC